MRRCFIVMGGYSIPLRYNVSTVEQYTTGISIIIQIMVFGKIIVPEIQPMLVD